MVTWWFRFLQIHYLYSIIVEMSKYESCSWNFLNIVIYENYHLLSKLYAYLPLCQLICSSLNILNKNFNSFLSQDVSQFLEGGGGGAASDSEAEDEISRVNGINYKSLWNFLFFFAIICESYWFILSFNELSDGMYWESVMTLLYGFSIKS